MTMMTLGPAFSIGCLFNIIELDNVKYQAFPIIIISPPRQVERRGEMFELVIGNELVIGFAALWTAILIRVRVGAAVRFPV